MGDGITGHKVQALNHGFLKSLVGEWAWGSRLVWVRWAPHPVIVTKRDTGDYLRAL